MALFRGEEEAVFIQVIDGTNLRPADDGSFLFKKKKIILMSILIYLLSIS